VKDSTGAVVGLVGVDMGSEEVIANTETAQKTLTPDETKALAAEIAGRIDGDAMTALQPGDEKSSAFIAIRDQLDAFRTSNPEILYIYTMRKAGNVTEYVVDADYGTGGYAVAIGDLSGLTEEESASFAGFTEPSVETYTLVYGYAPITNSSGAVIGMVCLDMKGPIAQGDLKALAAEIAGKIDGDTLATFQPGDESTAGFVAIGDQLDAFRDENPEILYIYTMRTTENATEYVVDADYGSSYAVAIGDDYTPVKSDTAFFAGFIEPSAAMYTTISGCAPVRNASGAGVGVVCVETESMISQEGVKTLAADIAARIDGDALAALQPGDENRSAFIAIHDQLGAFRASTPGVVYIYTTRKVGDTVEYVVDADYGTGDAPGIGGLCNNTDPEMVAGFTEPAAESEFSIEPWGNDTSIILSGYAPVKDSTGAIVGVVGVDMGRLQ
jgi:hypothetical protein